ncbi:hypothetical protein BASA83_000295 [Batrachochytrium salamandrivorans]|nr:hypothetical protein BASA83_000295 [Batrachochytrium salamandrivorans]
MPRSKFVVDNHIEEMNLNACLTLDAWSNIRSEPIVNHMLISDSSTFFLESVSTGEQNYNAKWIAQDMGRVIDYLVEKLKLQKAQLTENLPGLVQPAPTRWGFLKGVFRRLEKKVNTFCTASFMSGTSFKEQASRKRVSRKSMILLRTVSFVENLDKAIMIH